jgi:6-phosphogluconate dehydrogenase
MAEERTRKQVEDRLESHLIRTSNLTFLSEAFEKKPSEMTVVTKDLFLSFLADREKALKSLVERSIEIPS